MAKSYPEQLAEWIQRKNASKRDRNLVAFLAVRDDVKEAVAAGYAVKTIWANMRETGRIGFSYDTFLNYTKKMTRQETDRQAKTTKPASPSRPKSKPRKIEPKQATSFEFDPVAKEEDLY